MFGDAGPDRFIVRQSFFARLVTIGGGAVLDPLARRPKPCAITGGRAGVFMETVERASTRKFSNAAANGRERAIRGLGYDEIVLPNRVDRTTKFREYRPETFPIPATEKPYPRNLCCWFFRRKPFARCSAQILEKVENFKKNPLGYQEILRGRFAVHP